MQNKLLKTRWFADADLSLQLFESLDEARTRLAMKRKHVEDIEKETVTNRKLYQVVYSLPTGC